MSKLLKPFDVLWGISQVESNSIDKSGYPMEMSLLLCELPPPLGATAMQGAPDPCSLRGIR